MSSREASGALVRERHSLCIGTGRPAVSVPGSIYPHCPGCGREFGAQGAKARARLGNPWKAMPRHFEVIRG